MKIKKASKYFKECPYCGSKVVKVSNVVIDGVERNQYIYCCENFLVNSKGQRIYEIRNNHNLLEKDLTPLCNTYVNTHKSIKGGVEKGEPIGILADQELRDLHKEANKEFYILWSFKGINKIWDFIALYNGRYVRRISKSGDNTVLRCIETGRVFCADIDSMAKISERTKAHLWLANKMNVSLSGETIPKEAKIQYMDKQHTIQALNILTEANLKLKEAWME